MADFDSWLKQQKASGNYRSLQPLKRLDGGLLELADRPGEAQPMIDFSSNDYLALTGHPALAKKSATYLRRHGSGAGAARLMSGNLEIHRHLEEQIARLKSKEAALLFGSGYLANIGIIPALTDRESLVFTDRFDHASIYDGCLLSRARLIRFRHNDLDHLEDLLKKNKGKKQALIVVESLYSMDGDFCPLPELIAIKERFGCLLLVDEAHATGLYGDSGSGLIEEMGCTAGVDIAMGTFSKALGSYGAYVAASSELIEVLVNRARSFIFSTALPPAVIGASSAAVELIRQKPAMRDELHDKVRFFKDCLARENIPFLGSSQIVPVMVGDSGRAVELAQLLRQKGIYATAVRPPTVPQGTARLRFSVTRHHAEENLRQAATILAELIGRKSKG